MHRYKNRRSPSCMVPIAFIPKIRGGVSASMRLRRGPASRWMKRGIAGVLFLLSSCQNESPKEPMFEVGGASQGQEEGPASQKPGSGSKSKSDSKQQSPEGVDKIKAAGRFEIPEALAHPNGELEEEHGLPVSPGVTASCSTQNWTEREVRELTNRSGLDLSSSKVFPGALLQGEYFEKGVYSPITIPRAPGSIYLTGINLDEGAKYRAKDVEMSASEVNEAVQRLITQHEVQAAPVHSSYEAHVTYSADELLFRIGLDARFGVVDMKSDLSVGRDKARNYAFVKFTQIFYDVNFEDPELSASVFEDGEEFSDPEGQITAGNPPLYVSKVSYGRMVFFVAESTHDALEVKSALGAAVRGGVGTAKASSGLSFAEILSRSKIYYYVVGGAADLDLAPIKAADDSEMFSAVKDFIGDRETANFSAENPGTPIAYTLNYLSDRSPAKMAYTVDYDRRDCRFFLEDSDPDSKSIQVDLNATQFVVVPEKALGSGDTEFFSNGPEVDVRGKCKIVDDRVEFRLSMTAQETGDGDTHFHGKITQTLYHAPTGWTIDAILSPTEQRYHYIDKNTAVDKQSFGESSLFKRLEIVGDTWGKDLGKTKTTAVLNPLRLSIVEK